MLNSKLISVVIPVFNSEKYLEECLNSIFSQTYQNFEIIVVDDGSTDSSPDILEKYSDKIRIFTQKNCGLASALRHGIQEMDGGWFKWFSPDDVMYPFTLEHLIQKGNEFENTIVYSNWNIIDDQGNLLREFSESNFNHLSDFQYYVRLLDGQQINVNTSLIPSHLFENISFRDLDDQVAIDYDFFLRSGILLKTHFHLIEKPLIKYRIHPNQLSHKNISETLSFIEKIKDEILSDLEPELQQKFRSSLYDFQQNKSLKNKILDNGLNLIKNLPPQLSDNLLTFYLNKIRQHR